MFSLARPRHAAARAPIFVALLVAAALAAAPPAPAHNALSSMYAPAGYTQDLEMRVYHGCKDSPVKGLRVKIPDNVSRVNILYSRDWDIETRMRKLPKPVTVEGGIVISETIDEIIWKNPKSNLPAYGRYEGFRFRAALPDTPGAILFFRAVTVCENGEERYIDLPKSPLQPGSPDFRAKLGEFMVATPFPSPFVILEKPARPQYPFDLPTRK